MERTQDLFAALEAAQREIQEERRQLDEREAAIVTARETLMPALANGTSEPHGGTATLPQTRTRAGIPQKVAQHHLDAIVDYLARHGATRQADIARALGLNSGTVSLATRTLEEQGKARSLPEKERNSVVWALA